MSTITVASGWKQLDRRGALQSLGIILHIPRPNGSDHSVCGTSLHRATPVTPEGAAIGHLCV